MPQLAKFISTRLQTNRATQRLVRRVCAAVVIAACTSTADAAVIRLRPEARAAGAFVTLGDVAEITDPELAFVHQLAEKSLAPAPTRSQPLRLDFATIRARLEAQGIELHRLEFSGSSVVSVLPGDGAGPSIEGRQADWRKQQAASLAANAIRQHLERIAPELGTVTIDAELPPQAVPIVLASAASGFAVQGGAAPWDAPQAFLVRCRDERQQTHDIRIAARVRPLPHVLTLRHAVPAGYVLQAGDLVPKQTDEAPGAVTRLEEAVGRETRRTIRVGEVLKADDIQIVPLVRVNDIVTVYSRKPGIRVKRQLKARSEGALGDPVTLVTLDGRQTVLGRITGYHEADVDGAAAPAETSSRIQFTAASGTRD